MLPHIICTGSYEFLPYAKSKGRQVLANAQLLGGNGNIRETLPNGGTLNITVALPSTYRIMLSGGSLLSGLVNVGEIDLTVKKLYRFYRSSETSVLRSWQDVKELNLRVDKATELMTGSQSINVRSTMFSGRMTKVVALVVGQNVRVPWSWTWDKTHGIHMDSSGTPWLIEVSSANGVLAMKMPTVGGYGNSTVRAAIKLELGFYPGVKSFPTDLSLSISDGSVRQLLTPASLADFYTKTFLYADSGWAFNQSGSECQNIARGVIAGRAATFRFKIVLTPSGDGPTGAAFTLVESGKGYGAKSTTYGSVSDGTRFFVPTIALDALGRPVPSQSEVLFDALTALDFQTPPTLASQATAPLHVFYGANGVENVLRQTIYDYPLGSFFTASGHPTHDYFHDVRDPSTGFVAPNKGAAFGSDFSGKDIPLATVSSSSTPDAQVTTDATTTVASTFNATFPSFGVTPLTGSNPIIQITHDSVPSNSGVSYHFVSNSVYIPPFNRECYCCHSNTPTFTIGGGHSRYSEYYIVSGSNGVRYPVNVPNVLHSTSGITRKPVTQDFWNANLDDYQKVSFDLVVLIDYSTYVFLCSLYAANNFFVPIPNTCSVSSKFIYVSPFETHIEYCSASMESIKDHRYPVIGITSQLPGFMLQFFYGFHPDYVNANLEKVNPHYGRSAFKGSLFAAKDLAASPFTTLGSVVHDLEPIAETVNTLAPGQVIPHLVWVGYS